MEFDFWHDVMLWRGRPWRMSAARCYISSSVRRLPGSPSSACDVIGSPYALQFLIHSTFVHVKTWNWRAERCSTSYNKSVRSSVRPSHCVKTTQSTIMRSSTENSLITLISLWLISVRTSRRNIVIGGVEWKMDRKHLQCLANKLPYLREGGREDQCYYDRLIMHIRLEPQSSTLDDF